MQEMPGLRLAGWVAVLHTRMYLLQHLHSIYSHLLNIIVKIFDFNILPLAYIKTGPAGMLRGPFL